MIDDGKEPRKRGDPADTAGGHDGMDHQHGPIGKGSVEANRSWTIYHVFTPAHAGGQVMIGLDKAAATASMLSMNLRNVSRRMQRIRLNAPRLEVGENDVL